MAMSHMLPLTVAMHSNFGAIEEHLGKLADTTNDCGDIQGYIFVRTVLRGVSVKA